MSQDGSHIIVVGGGPSGLFLALLLLQQNHDVRITILESQTAYADIAKAYAFLPILFPDFKTAGIFDDLVAAAAKNADTGINFRLVSDDEKRVVAQMPKMPGGAGPLLLSQKRWLEIVKTKVEAIGRADVRMGCYVLKVDQGGGTGRPKVLVKNQAGNEETLSATYVVGADGSHSTVRKQCGIEFEGETLPQQLVATDVYYPFERLGWEGANFMIDEKYYGMIGPIDDKGLWRVSFGMLANTDSEIEERIDEGSKPDSVHRKGREDATKEDEIRALFPEWFNQMFPGPKPVQYEVQKVAAYRAQQRCAERFRRDKVLLIGDAAHVTNPYIGMGLATGLLDAASLAPVLNAILVRHSDGGNPEKEESTDSARRSSENVLLDSWAEARRGVFRNIIDPLSRAAFASVQDPDVASFDRRHPLLAKATSALREGKKPTPPPVRTVVESLNGWNECNA